MFSLSKSNPGSFPRRAVFFAALVLLTLCVAAAACADPATPTDLLPVTYDYNAGLYDPDSGDFPGVYTTVIEPNSFTADQAPTIGMPSIADGNLDVPTTESPAIIQGAAVGYEEKTGPVEYTAIKERPEPYSDYRVTILEEKAQDGTVHKKPSGFDGTYVITRLDVSAFFDQEADLSTQYLHMKQENNRALIPAAGMTDNNKGFADATGIKTGAYLLSDLIDKSGSDTSTPYIDVIIFATAANVAGADTGKTDMPNGDIPLQLYVDGVADYNPGLVYDPASTDPNHATNMLAKFFDDSKAPQGGISRYLIKGSDLALETAVENSSGPNKDEETTYWSLRKSLQDEYYDQEADASPDDEGCGRTVKLISEVSVTETITLEGADESHLRKRTLDVNSFDIQVANNTTTDQSTYSDGFVLQNAWLTIEDMSNTTGAEMAIGNNARFVIDAGGKLIIDATCQLEIEWDGATTTAAADGSTPAAEPDILNNGQLDLRAGGEIVNNGVITIEGFEGKPYQADTQEQVINSEKGCGEMTIREGATLTNNGALVVYGHLYNLGTLINNGVYSDLIISNDPDQGQFAYHKGIVIAWKDDVTQANVEPGTLFNGIDRDGVVHQGAVLINNGDIMLAPGLLQNYQELRNNDVSHIFLAAMTEAIIPITPDPATPTITSKRITLDPPKASAFENYGTLINNGIITPASVPVNDNTSLGAASVIGQHPELFKFRNMGTVLNTKFIYGWGPLPTESEDGAFLYLYAGGTFEIVFADGSKLSGSFAFDGDSLVFTPESGTVETAAQDNGDITFSFTSAAGQTASFVLTGDVVAGVRDALNGEPGADPIAQIRASL